MDTGLGRHGVGVTAASTRSPSLLAVRSRHDIALRIAWVAYLALLVLQYIPEGREALVDALAWALPGAFGDALAMLIWLGLLPVFTLWPFARRGQRRILRHTGMLLVVVNAMAEALRNLTLAFPPGQWLSNLDSAASTAWVGLVAGGLVFGAFRVLARVWHHWARHRRA